MFKEATIRKFIILLLLLVGIQAFGTTGYYIISKGTANLLDCFYMTFITIATIGYGEITPESHTTIGRAFTLVVGFLGIGLISYFFITLAEMVVGGDIARFFWRRKLMKTVNSYSEHYICCGCGNTGIHAINELIATKRQAVVIDFDAQELERLKKLFPHEYVPTIIGDATENEILKLAGIERAAGLVTSLAHDKDNLIVIYTARELDIEYRKAGIRSKPLRIISRATTLENIERMKKAGADSVISPNFIGGLRMISEMLRPTVVTFLDKMLRDRERNLRVDEVEVPEGSSYLGKTIVELNPRQFQNLLLLAIKQKHGDDWTYNPPADTKLTSDMILVFMGSPEGRMEIQEALKPK